MTTSVTTEFLSLRGADGELRCYVAKPMTVNSATPSIVLLMHLWGIDADQRNAARRFAEAGFLTIVPDLYSRVDAPDGDGINEASNFIPLARALTTENIDADIATSVEWLTRQCPVTQIAIAGFCMGGKMVWHRTRGYTSLFKAAAIWYGALPAFEAEDVAVPVVGSFGADDHGIPVDQVNAFANQLSEPHDIKIYPRAGHAFADSTRASYAPEAAEDSWARTIRFLRETMLGDG